jgi:hypothetical protein
MKKQLTILENLCYSTVRIECERENGQTTQGTAFFYSFKFEKGDVPVLVTNLHVIEGMQKGVFFFTKSDIHDNPIMNEKYKVEISKDFESNWIKHPDSKVDLCIMPVGPIFNQSVKDNIKPFFSHFGKEIIPNLSQLNELDVVENILMIGYPNGIWDQVNNMPIVRKGITATHSNINYNGKEEFLIDAACFPGSSGSPVILFDKGSHMNKNGSFTLGGLRLLFLGILYSGPQHTATGQLQIPGVPDNNWPISLSQIPNNLGCVIKSNKLLDFEDILKTKL